MSTLRCVLSSPVRVALLAGILAVPSVLRAAQEASATGEEITATAAAPESAVKLLAGEYRDEANLLKFCPPAGARIIQRGGIGMELVSFVVDAKQWGGHVQVVVPKKEQNVDEYLKQMAQELREAFKGVQILESSQLKVSGRPAGKQVASMEAEEVIPTGKPHAAARGKRITILRQTLAIRLQPSQYMVLNFFTPLSDQAQAIRTFDAMVSSFHVMDEKEVKARRMQALAAGKQWIEKLSAEDLKPKLIDKPQWFRIKVDERDVGFIMFEEKEASRDGYQGVLVTIASRTFPDKGSVITAKGEAFWAYRNAGPGKAASAVTNYSNWATTTENRYLARDRRTGEMVWSSAYANEVGTLTRDFTSRVFKEQELDEKGQPVFDKKGSPVYKVSERDPSKIGGVMVLTVARAGDERLDASLVNKTPQWVINPEYTPPLPKVMEYLWPRVVDLNKPNTSYAFVVFNSSTAKLGLRTLTVEGKQPVTIDGKEVQAYKLTDEIDPGSTSLWVDGAGKVLMMRTSDQSVLVPTTEQAMLKMWADQLPKAEPAPGRR